MQDIEKFIGGFRRFQDKYFNDSTNDLFDKLKRGQNPRSLFIACSDSRVDPALLTDCDPGDIFVVRNVASLVPPYEKDGAYHGVSSAIEYAVCVLKVRHIIVLGHYGCGGIRALLNGHVPQTEADFVGRWVRIADPARQAVLANASGEDPETQLRQCEMAAIGVSLDNLMTFPFIAERVRSGELMLMGWYFNIEEGALYQYEAGSHCFKPLVAGSAA
ncbi:carbonic anhydrase [Chitiniphilus shinanonensis]|uniref:Carbonic anhydrase n=1 Tax=Chitiniphilus shinanonensis TaxID=553088 RepID=A0ABQ6BV00_9NEIS|nr:carbonic anhydrase [Chitiniphilus shinanonensis]GLS05192.1 carbonic anhydrase [Chitiniphilus shinanonensis]